ncbi:MAG: C4-dicarboxylate ABC transporter substrate-binding protein [Blastopirellula sp.]|nr:MAG: C4-dicarboxylate ABC transporter substrate-binding protein [Blastopirellula sp.]
MRFTALVARNVRRFGTHELEVKKLERLLDTTEATVKWVSYVGALLLIPLILSMVVEVVARYVFDAPTLWAYEMAYFLTGSFFLLGIGYTLQIGGHVKVDLMTDLLPDRVNLVIYIVGYVFAGIFVIWSFWGLTESFLETYRTGETTGESAWNPVLWPFRAVAAFGFFVFAVQILVELYRNVSRLIRGEAFERKEGLMSEGGE